MRYTTIIFIAFLTFSCGQRTLTDQLEKERIEIENKIANDKNKLVVLVKVTGQTDLIKVIEQNWPDDIETTYNILKNQRGQIIYLGEFPTSESGDWSLGLKHYFGDNGKLIAFEKRLSYFNVDCTDGAVIETIIELYDNDFKVAKTSKTQTDNNGKELKVKDCEHAYNWDIDKRGTVTELVQLKKISV
ncbi:MAG: hypothetical protein KA713_01310 [Chryseotalea sp. WA131a]|nr:MAG: hypothetical protein KA713_01310 [Chryseotalea sp. WA131a]